MTERECTAVCSSQWLPLIADAWSRVFFIYLGWFLAALSRAYILATVAAVLGVHSTKVRDVFCGEILIDASRLLYGLCISK